MFIKSKRVREKFVFIYFQIRRNVASGKQACSRAYPPLAKHTTESKCDKFWKLAASSPNPLRPTVLLGKSEEFHQISIIEVREGTETHTCYKKENWEKNGWCQIEGSVGTDWGVCSSSCEFVHAENKRVGYVRTW